MPPPITPSPHRFIISNNRPPLSTRQPTTPVNKQFKCTPRFSLSSKTPQSTLKNEYVEVTSFAPRYVNITSNISKKYDIIDTEPNDSSCRSDGNVSNRNLGYRDTPKDKKFKTLKTEESIEEAIEEPSPKRIKQSLSPSPQLLDQSDEEPNRDDSSVNGAHDMPPSSPYELLSSPEPKKTIRAPRFLIPTQNLSSSPKASNFIKPPTFRPPDPDDSLKLQYNYLPGGFLSHRKGQEYIPGGLAAVLRDWLVGINSSTTMRPTSTEDPWLIKILVDDFSGDKTIGITLIKGRLIQRVEDNDSVDLTEIRIALAGEDSRIDSHNNHHMEMGKIVGVKGPLWNITIKNEKWIVGVEWKVL